jgi:hypothetical protein
MRCPCHGRCLSFKGHFLSPRAKPKLVLRSQLFHRCTPSPFPTGRVSMGVSQPDEPGVQCFLSCESEGLHGAIENGS